MFKKFLAFFLAIVAMGAAVFLMYWNYIRPSEYPVFIESFDNGVMTVDKSGSTGEDQKFRVMCKRGETITININPERTDSVYYDLSKLYVNGIDVTDEVSMLQYKTEVNHKLTVLAYFKKGERPAGYTASSNLDYPDKPVITEPFEVSYLGSRDAYNLKDPSIIFDDKSGYYYCFGSDNVVVRSKDLINWTDRTNYFSVPENAESIAVMDFDTFPSVKEWSKTHGYDSDPVLSNDKNDRTPLAPCIIKSGSTYYLYYSLCKSKDANEAAIFCVKTEDLAYSVENNIWTDVGLVISSCGYNKGENEDDAGKAYYDESIAVHPSVISASGKLYMAYGSYFGTDSMNGGIYLVELDGNTGLLKEKSSLNSQGEEISTVHGSDRFNTGKLIAKPGRVPAMDKKDGSMITAADLVYNSDNKYFYLFMTYGDEQTNYNVRVARSKSIQGPYLDYLGNAMDEFAASRNSDQYTKGFKVIGGYNFEKSSAGGASYTDVGRASTGSTCVFKSESGEWIMALQSRIYYKANGEIVTGDKIAKDNELPVNTASALEIRQLEFSGGKWPLAVPEVYAKETVGETLSLSKMSGNWDVIIFDNEGDDDDKSAVERNVSKVVSIVDDVVISERDIEKKNEIKSGTISKSGKLAFSIEIDGVNYTVYPVNAWDWELSDGTLTFTGIGEDGSTIWGKKSLSSDAGIYSDTFYYLLELVDESTKAKYEKKISKISDNPSQSDIDAMTNDLVEKIKKTAESENK
ncbi:MAG: family 43 glycosylhydrolase [Acutalibacteraceae bacterium]